jgi:hypothetical protein
MSDIESDSGPPPSPLTSSPAADPVVSPPSPVEFALPVDSLAPPEFAGRTFFWADERARGAPLFYRNHITIAPPGSANREFPASSNQHTLTIRDVCFPDPTVAGAIQRIAIFSYTFDINWLFEALPELALVPILDILPGVKEPSDQAAFSQEVLRQAPRATVHFDHMRHIPQYGGVHHTKAFFIVTDRLVRICIHTSNLKRIDWTHKSQLIWVQDFPLKSAQPGVAKQSKVDSTFEHDLIDYMGYYNMGFQIGMSTLLHKYDFSSARVKLCASVVRFTTP